jgi:hypothetical protein
MEPDRASAVQRDLSCPLTSHQVIVELIGATTTQTGLRVHAELNHGAYPLRVKVRDEERAALPLVRHVFHSECTCTIQPAQAAAEKPPEDVRPLLKFGDGPDASYADRAMVTSSA